MPLWCSAVGPPRPSGANRWGNLVPRDQAAASRGALATLHAAHGTPRTFSARPRDGEPGSKRPDRQPRPRRCRRCQAPRAVPRAATGPMRLRSGLDFPCSEGKNLVQSCPGPQKTPREEGPAFVFACLSLSASLREALLAQTSLPTTCVRQVAFWMVGRNSVWAPFLSPRGHPHGRRQLRQRPSRAPNKEPASGRDERGHFVKNNPGGKGNPFARRVAALRAALI